MAEGYIRLLVGNDAAYVRACSLDTLREADAAIFDCDGVLIDTRDSYLKSIVETVKYFVREFTDGALPSDETLRETVHLLKKSGGFNNDWDSVYTILLFLFSKLSNDFQTEFISLTRSEKFFQADTVRKGFDYVRTSLKSTPTCFTTDLNELSVELKQFTQKVDNSGIDSVEREFMNSKSKDIFLATKRFLNYPSRTRENLLTTVFDEMFYGPDLFKAIYKRNRQFYDGTGFIEIEREKTLVTTETLEELAQAIGRENFGIVSGRDQLSARFSLGPILDKFKREATLFLMDSNYPNQQTEKDQLKLKKPNPHPLLKAAEGLDQFKYSLYIGDSAEDMIMVNRANAIEPRFISVGVYALSDFQEELLSYFFSVNTDLVVYSIKELPSTIRAIKDLD